MYNPKSLVSRVLPTIGLRYLRLGARDSLESTKSLERISKVCLLLVPGNEPPG